MSIPVQIYAEYLLGCLHPLKMDPHFHNKSAKWKFWYLTIVFARSVLQFLYYLFLAAVFSSSRDSTSCDDRLVPIYWPTFQVFTLLQATSDPSIRSPQVDILWSCVRSNIFFFELMEAQLEAQQKQQLACRPDRENCPSYRLSFSEPGRDQDSQGLGLGQG